MEWLTADSWKRKFPTGLLFLLVYVLPAKLQIYQHVKPPEFAQLQKEAGTYLIHSYIKDRPSFKMDFAMLAAYLKDSVNPILAILKILTNGWIFRINSI